MLLTQNLLIEAQPLPLCLGVCSGSHNMLVPPGLAQLEMGSVCLGESSSPLFFTQVIGHSNFGTIRSTTCVYKGESILH